MGSFNFIVFLLLCKSILQDFLHRKAMTNINLVLTIRELCSLLRIGKNTAYDLVNSGQIRCMRIKGRIRIPLTSVLEFIQKNEQLHTGK